MGIITGDTRLSIGESPLRCPLCAFWGPSVQTVPFTYWHNHQPHDALRTWRRLRLPEAIRLSKLER